MTKPRLLLHPVHFESIEQPRSNFAPGSLRTENGFALTFKQGPFVSAWFPMMAEPNLECDLHSKDFLIVADHTDGKQKASLAHSYLVEVPVKQLQEMMQGK
jgi:hypothetical protein